MKKPFYLVAGLGQTGYSIAGYLQRRNLPFAVFDTRKHVERLTDFSTMFPGIEVFLGDFPSSFYGKITQIVASPGLSLEEPFLVQAKRHNIPIIGDIECFAQQVKQPVIAITGTNGKSTVTSLVGAMLQASGKRVAVGGNIGLPILDLVDNGEIYDIWVLELSSFQLELTYSLQPLAATVLNVSPDHLDRHHTLQNYIQAKQRIYSHAQYGLYNADDAATQPAQSLPAMESFCLEGEQQWSVVWRQQTPFLARGQEPFLSTDSLKLKGKHNWQNALAAAALATQAGVSIEVIYQVLTTFSGLPHRCQTVRVLNDVTWINDSKGTNVGAAISAIEGIGPTISGKIVLIAGGLGKGAAFQPMQPVVQQYVREAILIGKDAACLAEALQPVTRLTHAQTFKEAIQAAKKAAKPGDVVLLSPACASMDMFRDYVERGQQFAQLVEAL